MLRKQTRLPESQHPQSDLGRGDDIQTLLLQKVQSRSQKGLTGKVEAVPDS